jgi:integrase
MEFLKLFRLYIEHHSKAAALHDKRKPRTIDSYYVRYKVVTSYFYDRSLLKLQCKDFKIRLANEYFEFLSGKFSHNYSVRNVELCRAVLDFGVSQEIIRYNPLGSFRIKKTMPGKPVYITQDELKQLEEYKPTSSMRDKARRMFIFQCHTGMDFGDLTSVTADHIIMHRSREYIIKKRLKTGIEAFIPLTSLAKELLMMSGKMSLLSSVKYNAALKDIFNDLEIDKRITSHIGRKTYAMIKLNFEGYPIEAVSKMIGHKSIKTTEMYYAQVEIDLVHRELERLGV